MHEADADQVTQRPGWSSLATSVRELTIGSQAIVGLRPGFNSVGAGLAFPVSTAAGTRSSTDVSGRSFSRIETVRVGTADGFRSAWRSDPNR